MTTEKKLERCLEFLDWLERFSADGYDQFDSDDYDVSGECRECGSDDIDLDITSPFVDGVTYIDKRALDDIKDRIWHVRADIAD